MKSTERILIGLGIMAVILTACFHPKPLSIEAKSESKYTCPMHPQIMKDDPGSCPICGMNLVKRSGQASQGSGISLNTVLQPVNGNVISSLGYLMPTQKTVAVEISGDGYLDYDTRTFNNIASRFSGRIEKLYIQYAFQEIHTGQRIFDVYSPELVTAQQDLLFVTKNSGQETGLIHAAQQKLLLLGMTSAQVEQVLRTGKAFYSLPIYSPYQGHVHDMPLRELAARKENKTSMDFATNLPLSIKEGMYVEKGQTLFNLVNPHKLWAVIKIGPSEVSGLKVGQKVKISLPDMLGKTITGKVDFIEPVVQDGDKATSIRVYLDNRDHDLKVNSLVKATIQTGETKGLFIPRSAMVDLGQTQIVWLKWGNLYKAHQVYTGIREDKDIQIMKGLSIGDSLVSNAHYLSDSESFIKTQSHD